MTIFDFLWNTILLLVGLVLIIASLQELSTSIKEKEISIGEVILIVAFLLIAYILWSKIYIV